MLRAQLIEKHSVSGICKRFGLSRQSFYTIQEKFEQEGTAGLLPKKPGPQGPSKLTAEVLECIQKHLHMEEEKISTVSIKTEIEDRFGISLHRRTVEKLCKKLRVKKTLNEAPGQVRKMLVTDHTRVQYEKLRASFFEGMHEDNESWDRLLLFGIYGLFHETTSHREYRVEVYQIPLRRWWGKKDLQSALIREVFMQLIAIDHKENGHLIHYIRLQEEMHNIVRSNPSV